MTRRSIPRGSALLNDPLLNKGTAFTDAERDALGLRGLLPPRVFTMDEQAARVMENYRRKTTDLEKYIHLIALQDRNETLFYRTVLDHVDEMLPIIYTPTVGEACRNFGHIFRRARGLYVSATDKGRMRAVLRNWPNRDVSVIVVTDGGRILGLGDLGAFGMGIPIGKLSLYTTCAGIDPARTLPVMLDVGTDNAALLTDPLYTGLLQPRVRGEAYVELVEEFVAAAQQEFPQALLQFEDFATGNAISLLERFRQRACTFNDDIQGTAAVTLAGLISAGRVTGRRLADETILFYGAGAAATGIADLIVAARAREGESADAARRRIWFMDSKGLVVAGRADLEPHKQRYAHDHARVTDLTAAVEAVRPTVIVGVSGQAQAFSEPVVRAMGRISERPVVLALSNPTAKSECTAEQAYRWTDGRALFASGSPFPPVELNGRRFVPRQGNNAYIFPGVGLGVTAVRARHVTDEMFYAAARTLAHQVEAADLALGALFPPLPRIREVSARIAAAVAETAYDAELAATPRPADLAAFVRSRMWEPVYRSYVGD
ncbi:MAG TPA: NAD-dependent malic enzyme [Gemmatimonadales bacterium]|nr:NAD-dependent malic enzyme [Gemmatimonadales bacterium]